MKPVALITGASAGIGAALARVYAAHGHDLVLVARRRERLLELARELEITHGARSTVLAIDLAAPDAVEEIVAGVEESGMQVAVLVNNAGYGLPGTYLGNEWSAHADFLQVMVIAVARLTHHYAGEMRARGQGRIVNIASLAGHLPGTAGHTLYGAVKNWMIRFTESLAFELESAGITATAVCPGFTWSEFHDVTGTREQVSRLPDFMWMSAEAVAEQTYTAAEQGRIVWIPGRINRLLAWLARHLPRALVYRLVRERSSDFRSLD